MVIGITGSIACGKTIVLDYLKSKGFVVYSLDTISHELFDDININKTIKQALNINTKDVVKREEVSKIVFENPNLLEKLNNILHPLILNKMQEIIKNHIGNIFIEVPLLYECHLESFFQKIIFLYVTKEIQVKRLMDRNNISKEEAIKRINGQICINKKKEIAIKNDDYIIDNSGEIDYTLKEIDKFINQYIKEK